MTQRNFRSSVLLLCVTALSVVLLVLACRSTARLPIVGRAGLAEWFALLILSVAASRFTVSVAGADGLIQSTKSVADAFVFLAVMIYAVSPTATAGPAALLGGTVGFISSYRSSNRSASILPTAIAVISTYIAASCYGFLVDRFGQVDLGLDKGLPLHIFLVPVCVLAVLQYLFSTLATSALLSDGLGQTRRLLKQDGLVWSLTTEVASAATAVLFYCAIRGGGLPFILLGLLITGLTHLLYRFNEKHIAEVRLAEAEKVKHIKQMAEIHMNTIESLAIAIDAKDQTTHGHVRRTQIYATEMGKLFDVSESELQALVAGALLHDIGKLAVPEYILNKPGKLTEAEFAKMKIHPTVGGDILKRVSFPYPVEDIVRYHHEKWDGTGYPKGLKAESIPLVARIISVVDFYDATRCDRPYRKGMKREESLALLKNMAAKAFDPRVVSTFTKHVEEFDRLIDAQDIGEQVDSEQLDYETATRPDAGLAPDVLGTPNGVSGFRSITEAQREVFALHEIAQTIGSSLNLNDTVTLVSNKLRAIVPFETCVIFIVDEKSGKAVPAHAAGEHADLFSRRRVKIGEGITGWVIATARSMCNASVELDLVGVPDQIVKQYQGVLVSPLVREDGAFGAIALYSKSRTSYTTEHVRLLESVAQHAASALNNALTYEKTKESALIDPQTQLPNARGFYMMCEQRIAECQRMNHESLALISVDIDDFKKINDRYGHAAGDRLLASVATVMRKELRQMDILTRYAGDEFVAIMPMASGAMAELIGTRLRLAVEAQKFSVREGRLVEVLISVGTACFPTDGETTEELLTAAGRNMQRDKNSRKTLLTLASTPTAVAIETLG